MQRISEIARQVLALESEKDNIKYDSIAYGDLDNLHMIFEKSGMKVKISHPLNKHQSVLNAINRESKRPDAVAEV